jgi:hypothetical protein
MSLEVDSNGRLYLSAKLRRKYGEKFHVVEYEDRLELVPIDEDPIQALREAAGGAFDGKSVDELRDEARAQARRDAEAGLERRERPAGDDTE